MRFSIITPAYNESEHIEKCILSVLNQTFKDYEMIVIDDGSKDDTAEKVELFTQTDKRIKMIRMDENVGLTAAKNAALEKVNGEYLVFVDADDWILPNMLSDLAEQLKNFESVDMFRLKQKKVYSRSEKQDPDHNFQTQLYKPVDLISEGKMSGNMCNLVVKNKLVQKHNICFRPGQVMLEDQEFTLKCMVYSSNVLYYTKQNYMYYQYPGSLSKNEKTEQLPDILNCAMNVYDHAKNHLQEKDLRHYREYTLWKCDQFLKAVFKDKNFPLVRLQEYMNKFFDIVDLSLSQRLLQTAKYYAVKMAKRAGV